jgi:hypothetical protein
MEKHETIELEMKFLKEGHGVQDVLTELKKKSSQIRWTE